MEQIKLEQVRFREEGKILLAEMNFVFPIHETVVFAGTAESGRSLLLKIMAGILAPTSGNVLYDGQDIFNSDIEVIKEIKRKIGFSFQVEGLLSNLTIEENIFLPVKFYNADEADTYLSSVTELLDFFMIRDTLQKRPAELSMQKTKLVSFIRAIILKPQVLFVDDPLFSLDIFHRNRMLECLRILLKSGMTLLLVSNSPEIIRELADRIIIIRKGRVESQYNKDQITQQTIDDLERMFTGI